MNNPSVMQCSQANARSRVAAEKSINRASWNLRGRAAAITFAVQHGQRFIRSPILSQPVPRQLAQSFDNKVGSGCVALWVCFWIEGATRSTIVAIGSIGSQRRKFFEAKRRTPYFLNLHNGEIAHTLILGMTGSGNSFLRRCAPQRMPPKQMEFWLSQPELSS
jgi:hypothetical protein